MPDGTAVNPELRPNQHGGITHVIMPNGTAAATTHPALVAAITRARLDQEQQSGGHPKATPAPTPPG